MTAARKSWAGISLAASQQLKALHWSAGASHASNDAIHLVMLGLQS
jgi:hypothetical protein